MIVSPHYFFYFAIFILRSSLFTIHFLHASADEISTDEDERDAENLSHVDRQGGLEGHLNLFGVLDEEAE